MQTLSFELKFTENQVNKSAVPVIIVAAGSSTRMNGIAKPFAKIGGIPTIARTLLCFQNSPNISNIILVTKSEYIPMMQEICDEYAITKLSDLVCGGSCRQESVFNGLKAIKNAEKVLIHDGARPFVSKQLIDNICDKLSANDCVICGVKPKDTIKSINDDRLVYKTHNRDNLLCVQTPQGVNLKKYLNSLKEMDATLFTDDASIMEAAGIPVLAVEGEYTNIKITTPEDLLLAELYLKKLGGNL